MQGQWRSQRGGLGGSNPPPLFASKRFFHSRKVTAIKRLSNDSKDY